MKKKSFQTPKNLEPPLFFFSFIIPFLLKEKNKEKKSGGKK